jgi:predicted metal-binding membrane protein
MAVQPARPHGAAAPPGLRDGPFALWRAGVIGALLLLAIPAWIVTDLRMAGMDEGPGTNLGGIGFFVTVWLVMMAAMMFPSVAPMVATYAGLQRGRRAKAMPAPAGASACFVAGYLLIWTATGLLAYGLLEAGRALAGDPLAWDAGGRWLAAGVLLAAASYELTPLKAACLTRCRSPLAFVLDSWRDGRAGALRMGVLHGAWCVGCCWALMAALFALGAMSLAWTVVIAALIAAEKLLPWRSGATIAVTAVLVALGAGVAVAPDRVPGFTVPTQGMQMHMASPVR